MTQMLFDSIPVALEAMRRGSFVIAVDNEDRENEGDLIIAAQFMTQAKCAFMVRETSGVLCVAAPSSILDRLELPNMVQKSTDVRKTAYTISVDYKHGTTTGISAHDRALAISELANPSNNPSDFTRPGHVFPLRYSEGGVLTRQGHTEASVDLCILAGLSPVAAIAEIVSHDGSGNMARRDELCLLAKEWNLPFICISDLVAYRQSHPF